MNNNLRITLISILLLFLSMGLSVVSCLIIFNNVTLMAVLIGIVILVFLLLFSYFVMFRILVGSRVKNQSRMITKSHRKGKYNYTYLLNQIVKNCEIEEPHKNVYKKKLSISALFEPIITSFTVKLICIDSSFNEKIDINDYISKNDYTVLVFEEPNKIDKQNIDFKKANCAIVTFYGFDVKINVNSIMISTSNDRLGFISKLFHSIVKKDANIILQGNTNILIIYLLRILGLSKL